MLVGAFVGTVPYRSSDDIGSLDDFKSSIDQVHDWAIDLSALIVLEKWIQLVNQIQTLLKASTAMRLIPVLEKVIIMPTQPWRNIVMSVSFDGSNNNIDS